MIDLANHRQPKEHVEPSENRKPVYATIFAEDTFPTKGSLYPSSNCPKGETAQSVVSLEHADSNARCKAF